METRVYQFIFENKYKLFRHVLFLLFFSLAFLPPSISDFGNVALSESKKSELFYKLIVVQISDYLLLAGFVYFNYLVLIPKFLYKKKFIIYFFFILVLCNIYFLHTYTLFGYYMCDLFNLMKIQKTFGFKAYLEAHFVPIFVLAATTGYKLFKFWILEVNKNAELQTLKLSQELSELKNQVNPHFLFNTFNNLNTLIKTDPDKASQVIYGLSDVLRYQIYDSQKDKVVLSQDIENIKQILSLEKIRRDRFSYEVKIDENLIYTLMPPLLFTNFIDNAMKHSLDSREESFIEIEFKCEGNFLTFICKNSIPDYEKKNETGGIGLINIKRRLDLMYGGNYTLDLDHSYNLYVVTLKIPK